MRILVISELYPPHYIGGAELSCREHVEGLRGRGHDVSVLTSSWGLERPSSGGGEYRVLHTDPLTLTSRRDGRARGAVGPARWIARVARPFVLGRNLAVAREVLARVRPQVAYVWNMRYVSVRPVLVAQAMGIPIVYRVEDYWLADLRRALDGERAGLRRRYRAATAGLTTCAGLDTRHLLMNSQALRQNYAIAGFDPEGMTLIPTGLPAEYLLPSPGAVDAPAVRGNGVRSLAYVGRLSPEKGLEVAIRALALLTRERVGQDVTLDVIGSGAGAYRRRLASLVERLSLDRRVRFVGKVDHDGMIERYARYDVLLFPSLWAEPFGRSVVEAMARGVPVVATRRGGPAEIIADGETGVLVPPGDAEAMAGAVVRLLTRPALWRGIREAALERVRRDYTLDGTIARVEAYIGAVVAGADTASAPRGAQCAS